MRLLGSHDADPATHTACTAAPDAEPLSFAQTYHDTHAHPPSFPPAPCSFPRLMSKAHKRRMPWALFTLCDPMLRPLQQGLFRMVGGMGGAGWGGGATDHSYWATAAGAVEVRCGRGFEGAQHAWLMPVCDTRVLATRCAGQVGRVSLLDNPL